MELEKSKNLDLTRLTLLNLSFLRVKITNTAHINHIYYILIFLTKNILHLYNTI